jgi:uncharacterized protein (DUF433 family)
MDWRPHISVDPRISHGQACIAGTRVLVSVLLDSLAAGETPAELIAAYNITREDLTAALAYAAALSRERTLSTGAA